MWYFIQAKISNGCYNQGVRDEMVGEQWQSLIAQITKEKMYFQSEICQLALWSGGQIQDHNSGTISRCDAVEVFSITREKFLPEMLNISLFQLQAQFPFYRQTGVVEDTVNTTRK